MIHFVARVRHQEHRELQELAAEMKEQKVATTALLVQGVAGEAILEQAERIKADLIILGSHGHGAVYHLLTGSVSKAVLKHSTCPVLIVPTHKR